MGSDLPHLPGAIDRAVPFTTALPIPVAERATVLGGTARSVLHNR